MERKLPRNKFVKNFGLPREIVFFFRNFGNAVLFVTGSCRKFKPDVLLEWKAPLLFTTVITSLLPMG